MNNSSTSIQMSSVDFVTGETTLNVPYMDGAQRLRSALGFAAAAARRRFPHSSGRIDAASRLLCEGKVVLHEAGTATVQSETGEQVYEVNGQCTCPDAPRAPEGWCKHRLAAALARKALRLVAEWAHATEAVIVTPQEVDEDEGQACPVLPPSVPVVPSEGVDATPDTSAPAMGIADAFVTHIQGKPFVVFAGLLDLAHRQGLLSLTEEVTHVSDTYVLARARAEFSDGRVFCGAGDSTPDNVGKQVKAHWRRLAGTRAMARCLRNALNIGMVAVEELE